MWGGGKDRDLEVEGLWFYGSVRIGFLFCETAESLISEVYSPVWVAHSQ